MFTAGEGLTFEAKPAFSSGAPPLAMDTLLGTDLAHAAALLRAGELVAIPTETVYGLSLIHI